MVRQREIVVFVDRSRDGVSVAPLGSLGSHPGFRLVENERRLSGPRLRGCDVLMVQGCGAPGYGRAELRAIREFVRQGGGLVLAVSAGAFETESGRPAAESAAEQVARLFGVRFVSPREAEGRAVPDGSFVEGYRRKELVFSGAGPFMEMTGEALVGARWAPLIVPRGARAVLRHRRTGEAVAAVVRHGKGRVLAANVRGFGVVSDLNMEHAVRWLAGRRGRRGERAVEEPMTGAWSVVRRGEFGVRRRGVGKARAEAVADLAASVLARLRKRFSRKAAADMWLEVVPGAGCAYEWNWRQSRHVLRVGAATARASMIYGLAVGFAFRLMWGDVRAQFLWRTVGMEALASHVALGVLESFGFSEDAARRRAVLESWPDGRGDPRRMDLARWRWEAGPGPAAWMWGALERDFGPRIVDRFLKMGPRPRGSDEFARHRIRRHPPHPRRRGPDELPPVGVVNEFDLLVHFLSRAAGRDLSGWFAERGTTVCPLPAVCAADKGFARRWEKRLRRCAGDERASWSERLDAVCGLAWLAGKRGTSRSREEAVLRAEDDCARLVAGARLAQAKDERGRAELRALAARGKDAGYAAIAGCFLAEAGDAGAAGRLLRPAAGADARFRLRVLAATGRENPMQQHGLNIDVRREEYLKYLGVVDGYVVANVMTRIEWQRWPGGIAVPDHFVTWVQTSPDWRRRGISRALLAAALGDRWARGVPVSTLNTGVSNVAHSLYREMGFVDLAVRESWARAAEPGPRAARAAGVSVREARSGDAGRMAALFEEVYRDYFGLRGRRRPSAMAPDAVALLAERGGSLIGYALATVFPPSPGEKPAMWVNEICVKAEKGSERVAAVLAVRLCRLAARRGVKTVSVWSVPEDEGVLRGLQGAGFVRSNPGSVEMWQMNDLAGLLAAIRPLLERRLMEAKQAGWCGTIAVRGEKHRAALRIRRGRVTVSRGMRGRADIALEAEDDAVSRVVAGRQTAFEAMLQGELRIRPRPTEEMKRLLDALFPRMKLYLWNWW